MERTTTCPPRYWEPQEYASTFQDDATVTTLPESKMSAMAENYPRRAVVAGGGIVGLTAGIVLHKAGRHRSTPDTWPGAGPVSRASRAAL